MKKPYLEYKELLKREQHLNRLKEQGFKLIYSKSRFKVVCGVGCLVVAVIPNGTAFFMLPLGLGLLGIGLNDVKEFKENLKFKVWLKLHTPKNGIAVYQELNKRVRK